MATARLRLRHMSTTAHVGKTIENLTFDNKALRSLPLDEEKRNFIRTVPGACFSLVVPTPVENPRLICVSPSALALLDLEATEANKQEVWRTSRDSTFHYLTSVCPVR